MNKNNIQIELDNKKLYEINFKKFDKLYPDYNEKIFYIFNNNLLDIFLNKFSNIKNNSLFLKKIYHLFNVQKVNFIHNEKEFLDYSDDDNTIELEFINELELLKYLDDINNLINKPEHRVENKRLINKPDHRVENKRLINKPDNILENKRLINKPDHRVENKRLINKPDNILENKRLINKPEHRLENKRLINKPDNILENKRLINKPEHRLENKRLINKPDNILENKRLINKPEHRLENKRLINKPEHRLENKRLINKPDNILENKRLINKPEHRLEKKRLINKPEHRLENKRLINKPDNILENKRLINKPEHRLENKRLINKPDNILENKRLWAYLHCYDLDKFYEKYGYYIKNIMGYFRVVVTYCVGNSFIIKKDINFHLLKCNNNNIKNELEKFLDKNSYIIFFNNLKNLCVKLHFFEIMTFDIIFNGSKIILSYNTLKKLPNIDIINNNNSLFNFILYNDLNYFNIDEIFFIKKYINSFLEPLRQQYKKNISLKEIILYRIYNSDLLKMDINNIVYHYINIKNSENRYIENCILDLYNYWNNIKLLYLVINKIPSDFNWKSYFYLNNLYNNKELLLKINENNNYFIYITEHYKKYKFNYHPKINIYDYLYFNNDLNKINNLNLVYKNYFQNEKKDLIKIKTPNKTNNILFNNCIIFINHESSLTGAPIFLYDLIIYLDEINFFSNIILLEPYPNKNLNFIQKKINSKIIYFYNNENTLEEIINNYNPNLIYCNSVSIFNIKRFKKYYYKSIFHYHETYNCLYNFLYNVLDINIIKNLDNNFKTYVVSDIIQKEYHKNKLDCEIFPPFLSNKKINILNNIKNTISRKSIYDNDIVFGMCGSKSKRKGYDIFLEIVKSMPQYKFIWIGGVVDTSIQYDNFIQIPQTYDPYSIILRDIDYMLITSRVDPCPFVILESLYLNTPCIILENNIKYNHPIDKHYYVISDHNNDPIRIIKYINELNLTKKNIENNSNLKEYINKNFIKPKFLQNIRTNININKTNNKICLLLSLYNINKDGLDYYNNIVNILNLTYNFQIDIILLINTGNVFNNNFNYIECDNYTLFGINKSELINKLYIKYSIIKHSKIIFVPNRGNDIGSFLIGLNYGTKKYEYIIKLHYKSNIYWREMLMDIIYKNVFKINENNNYDTFINKSWHHKTNIYLDDNLKLLLDSNDIFNITKDEWFYPSGSIFITKYKNLITLTNNFIYIYNFLNDENSCDKLWIEKMNSEFNLFYLKYSNCKFNKSLSKDANIMREKYNCKNYYELYNKGYRGIPDYSPTHALERYFGYIICLNKKIYLI